MTEPTTIEGWKAAYMELQRRFWALAESRDHAVQMLNEVCEALAAGDSPCSCGGSGWVDDSNWQGNDIIRSDRRSPLRKPYDGLIACGFCNEGGDRIPAHQYREPG